MIDFSPYEARRNAATQQYGATTARNAYANFLSKTRGQRNLALLKEQNLKLAPNAISSYVRRGMAGPNVKSGVFSQGLQDLATQAFRNEQDLQDQINQGEQMSNLEQAQTEADYRAALAGIEADKAREISQVAATLGSFKPFLS